MSWLTWINATLYNCEHWEKIRSVIQLFDENVALSIEQLKII